MVAQDAKRQKTAQLIGLTTAKNPAFITHGKSTLLEIASVMENSSGKVLLNADIMLLNLRKTSTLESLLKFEKKLKRMKIRIFQCKGPILVLKVFLGEICRFIYLLQQVVPN